MYANRLAYFAQEISSALSLCSQSTKMRVIVIFSPNYRSHYLCTTLVKAPQPVSLITTYVISYYENDWSFTKRPILCCFTITTLLDPASDKIITRICFMRAQSGLRHINSIRTLNSITAHEAVITVLLFSYKINEASWYDMVLA